MAYLFLADRLVPDEGIGRATRSTAGPGTKVLLWRQFRLMLEEVRGKPQKKHHKADHGRCDFERRKRGEL